MPDTRDDRAIAQIECPVCKAPPGTMCDFGGSRARRPNCHTERRKANQDRLREAETEVKRADTGRL